MQLAPWLRNMGTWEIIQERAHVHCASAFPGLWLKVYGVSSVHAVVGNSPFSKATK